MSDEARVEDGGSDGVRRAGGPRRGTGARRESPRGNRAVGDFKGYEIAQMRLEHSWRPDSAEDSHKEGGKALGRAAYGFAVEKAMFRSGGIHVHAFGCARNVVRLLEWLGNLGFGGYKVALNTRHDAAFGGAEFVDEVEVAGIMLPHLLNDPSRSKPCWGRLAYRALLEDRYGPGGTGTIVEAYGDEFAIDARTGLSTAV